MVEQMIDEKSQREKSSKKYLAERFSECMPDLVTYWDKDVSLVGHCLMLETEGVGENGQHKALCPCEQVWHLTWSSCRAGVPDGLIHQGHAMVLEARIFACRCVYSSASEQPPDGPPDGFMLASVLLIRLPTPIDLKAFLYSNAFMTELLYVSVIGI